MNKFFLLCCVATALLSASCSGSGNSGFDVSKISDEDKENLTLNGYDWSEEVVALPEEWGLDFVDLEIEGLKTFVEGAKDVSKLNKKDARVVDMHFPFPGKIYLADYITEEGNDGFAVLLEGDDETSWGYTLEKKVSMEAANSDATTRILTFYAGEQIVGTLSEEERLAGIVFINTVRGEVPFFQHGVTVNYDGKKTRILGVMTSNK